MGKGERLKLGDNNRNYFTFIYIIPNNDFYKFV